MWPLNYAVIIPTIVTSVMAVLIFSTREAASWKKILGGVLTAIAISAMVLSQWWTLHQQEKRHEIRESLGKFISKGEFLMSEIRADMSKQPVTGDWKSISEECNHWNADITEFIKSALGEEYVVRLTTGINVPPVGVDPRWEKEHTEYWVGVRVRLFHLNEFMQELSK